MLDLVKQGERIRVFRDGKPDAMLVPIDDHVDPSWDEIMKEVRAMQKEDGPQLENPVLAERKRRDYAAHLR